MLEAVQRSEYKPPFAPEKISPKIPNLAYEVAKIRNIPGQKEMYLLPDTGFHVKDQVRLLQDNLRSGVSFKDSMKQVKEDVQGFKLEYLVEQPVFPIALEKAMYQGRMRLVGRLYGGKPLVDVTSADERHGAVRKSIEEIEEHALNAEPGTLIVMSSSKGWSGYQSRDGVLEQYSEDDVSAGRAKEITYPDSQTYCFQVQNDGNVRGFTLKSDMNIFQNEELLKSLGVEENRFSDDPDIKQRIKNVVRNVAYVEPSKGKTIEDVVDKIQAIKKGETAYKDSTGEARTFSEMRGLVKNPESLFNIDEVMQSHTDSFEQYVAWRIKSPDENMTRDIEVALGHIVMSLMHEIRPPKDMAELRKGVWHTVNRRNEVFDPKKVLTAMQKIAGCAGGGQEKTVRSINPRKAKEKNGDTDVLCCTCPFCGRSVEALIGGGKIVCPECNASADWSEAAAGE